MDEADEEGAPELAQAPPEREEKEREVAPLRVSLYARAAERDLARHFHAVRLSKSQRPDSVAARGKPLILYFNHPSWWDPLIGLLIAQHIFPERRHYAPIDVGAPSRHRFFERLGFFGVEAGTPRGARRFLTLAQTILARPDAALWVPAEARLSDPRERPVQLRSGIGHLASRVRQAVVLPLALEVPFWDEPLPEALARFGEEVPIGDADLGASDWTAVLENQLESTLDALAAESLARDSSRFETLVDGGVAAAGGVSGIWRRFKARLTRPS